MNEHTYRGVTFSIAIDIQTLEWSVCIHLNGILCFGMIPDTGFNTEAAAIETAKNWIDHVYDGTPLIANEGKSAQ